MVGESPLCTLTVPGVALIEGRRIGGTKQRTQLRFVAEIYDASRLSHIAAKLTFCDVPDEFTLHVEGCNPDDRVLVLKGTVVTAEYAINASRLMSWIGARLAKLVQ